MTGKGTPKATRARARNRPNQGTFIAAMSILLLPILPLVASTSLEPSITKGFVDEISRAAQVQTAFNASPKCWNVALKTLSEIMYIDAHSSQDFCSGMTQLQQDVLSLELARCHLEKSRTSFLFEEADSTVSEETCSGGHLSDQIQVDACLGHLNTVSYHIFVQFTMHVQQLCVRFTDEIVAARKEQAAFLLVKSSHAVSTQLADLIGKNENLLNSVVEQQKIVGNQSRIVEQLNDVIEQMRQDLSSTTAQIQPLYGLESVVKNMTQGFSWFTSFLHFLIVLNVAWLLTISTRSRSARPHLLNIIMFEALLEVLSHVAVYHGYFDHKDQVKACTLWRKSALVLEVMAYVLAMLASILGKRDQGEIRPPDSAAQTEVLRASYTDFLEQVVRESAEASRGILENQKRHFVELSSRRAEAEIDAAENGSTDRSCSGGICGGGSHSYNQRPRPPTARLDPSRPALNPPRHLASELIPFCECPAQQAHLGCELEGAFTPVISHTPIPSPGAKRHSNVGGGNDPPSKLSNTRPRQDGASGARPDGVRKRKRVALDIAAKCTRSKCLR